MRLTTMNLKFYAFVRVILPAIVFSILPAAAFAIGCTPPAVKWNANETIRTITITEVAEGGVQANCSWTGTIARPVKSIKIQITPGRQPRVNSARSVAISQPLTLCPGPEYRLLKGLRAAATLDQINAACANAGNFVNGPDLSFEVNDTSSEWRTYYGSVGYPDTCSTGVFMNLGSSVSLPMQQTTVCTFTY